MRADVCIVGAGPAGLTTACDLLRAGLDVLVLEAGPAAPAPGGDDVQGADAVGLPYPLRRSRAAGIGGSSLRWNIDTPVGGPYLRLRPLDALDMESRPGLRPGWPLTRADLEPWYTRAWATFGLRPLTPEAQGSTPAPLVPTDYAFGPAETFTERLPREVQQALRGRLVASTRVLEVLTGEDGAEVSGLRCAGPEGPLTVVARHYVLAAGGVDNARLLLASRSSAPEGLGNRHDQVGRCFMEHPHYASGLVVVPDGRLLWERARWDVVPVDGQAQQRKHRLSDDILRQHDLPGAAFFVTPRPVGKPVHLDPGGELDAEVTAAVHGVRMALLTRRWDAVATRDVARALLAAPPLARSAWQQRRALAAARRGRTTGGPVVFTLSVMAEQLPAPVSRVSLIPARDPWGVPRALLDWQVAELDRSAMVLRHRLAAPALERVFGGRVLSFVDAVAVPHLGEGYHHMGTTRMSADPAFGVVDRDCRVHGTRNLWAAGSSVFSSGGYANPTLTIVALAHRLADRLGRSGGAT
jgi:choline dehydrogenase-like flavoprotein